MTNRYHILTALLLTLVVSFSSCHKPEQEEITVAIKYTEVGGERGTQWVQVLTMSDSQQWTLSLTDEDGNPVTWATVDPPTGTGTQYSVTVTWDENETSGPRTLVIHGVSAGQESNVSLVQNATSPSGGGGGVFPDRITPDKVYGWMELPATNDPNLYFISHESTTSKAYRNFSYYWDVNNMVALWVAYPLNKASIGSGSRTNYWDLDPKLPVSAQPLLTSGYKSTGSSGESDGGTQFYQRGHQCPSADRLAYADNIQTFYGTNITPQLGELNEAIWAGLEQYVRNKSYQFDTLYVVTGCVVKGSTKFAWDNSTPRKKVTVPVAYYKALLGFDRTRSRGITAQTQGYTGVGFYLEHREYPDQDYIKCAMTIDDLERMLGYDLFVNLPAEVGSTIADKVESSKDTYWWTGE